MKRLAALVAVGCFAAMLTGTGSAATNDAIRVSLAAGTITVTAPAGLTAFADTETLIVQDVAGGLQVSMDEGSARLWSDSANCTQATPATPALSISCTGTIRDVVVDFSAASVATQSAYNGTKTLTFAGGSGSDYVQGGNGTDTINGGAGDDDLFGGSGDDTVVGGFGGDTIEGELGLDWMYGGPGVDDIDAEDGIADRAVNCGATFGDAVQYDTKLETPVLCDGPSLSVANPRSGGPGTYIQLWGAGMEQFTGVTIGGKAGTIVRSDTDGMVIIAPAGAGKSAISLIAGNKSLPAGTFTYRPAPVIKKIDTTRAIIGQTITVSGTNLVPVTAAFIGKQPAAVWNDNAGHALIVVPVVPRAGQYDVTIVTPAGSSSLSQVLRVTW